MISHPDIKGISDKTFSGFSYSRINHFDYFHSKNIDHKIYDAKINPDESDVKKYQNMLVYSYVTENLKPGSRILEIGNMESPVSKILNSEGYHCWRLGFKFEIPDNRDLDRINIEWILINDKGERVNNFPEEYFDFSFAVSAFVYIPENAKIFKSVLHQFKRLIKPLGNSLFCFLNVFAKDNKIWQNGFMDYLFENTKTANKKLPLSEILTDKNIFIMSEEYFNKYWKVSDEMTYEKNGRMFSYSVLWQNNEILLANGFKDFTYSKKSHFDIFNELGYSRTVYGRNISGSSEKTDKYQNLLLYSFVYNNLEENSKILILGKADPRATDNIGRHHNVFYLKDSESLTKNMISDSNSGELQFFNADGEKAEFYPVKYFDLIFSFNGFVYSETNLKEFATLQANIKMLLSPFGYSLFSFTKYFFKNIPLRHEIVRYLFLKTEKFNRFVGYKKMLEDDDLFTEKQKNFHYNARNPKAEVSKVVYNILWNNIPKLPTITNTRPSESLKSRPAFVFHHLMKCGGTSVVYALYNWFSIIFEHYEAPNGLYKDINDYHRYKLNIDSLVSDTCIVAHFQNDGYFLTQRYPEIIDRQDEFKAFTFVREPLELIISLYYYSRDSITCSLEHYINGHKNFLANLIPCDEHNYREVMDRYFFIGIVERMQESFDKLADMSGKPRLKLPYANKSKKDDQIENLSPEFIRNFKKNNRLDYLIYNYCMEKLDNY